MKNLTVKLVTLAAIGAAVACSGGLGKLLAFLGAMLCVEVSLRFLHALA